MSIRELLDAWRSEAEDIEAHALVDASTLTGMRAERVRTLREVDAALRPLVLNASAGALADLIRRGDLIPVRVFGAEEATCPKCGHTFEDDYGLADRFTTHSPSGSDCNRAIDWIMRPTDDLMQHEGLRSVIAQIWRDPWNDGEDEVDRAIAATQANETAP